MPTPSAPDPQMPYAFSSTCPDLDDSTISRNDTTVVLPASSIHHRSATTEDDTASRSTVISPVPHYDDTDGPVPDLDADADASSPVADNPPYRESHKTPEVDLDRTTSPRGPSPVDHIQTSRPPHNLGTSHLSAPHIDIDVTDDSHYQPGHAMEHDYTLPSMGRGYPARRVIPSSPSSFLRAGSRFTGTQQSERQVYDVQVEIKYVDLRESFLCGYLRIQGLTDDHPTLTTYFEGEIIGTKYGFTTKHESWGANDKTDLSHWSKFPAFRPYSKQARRGSSVFIKDVAQSEHIFMRWKEHFLVPDHRVRTITGASFEGFYYICFNQVQGEINGIYFHSKSERFQQLELKHVEDRGCLSVLEFR